MNMKSLVVVLVCVAVLTAEPIEHKRQLSILALAAPALTSLITDKLGISKYISKFVGDVSSFFKGHSGHLPLQGTQIVLDFNIHKCSLHFGKRFLIKHLAERRCKASAAENKITHTSQTCERGDPKGALECAVHQEVTVIQKLAQQAAAQQG